ncbi:MAG: single-stranded DNA-binding protein [Flavobacteriaceae bacterium]|nr:single-stranded DNA-binding protein [Flavobacteriaceae bacterium]
MNAIKNKVQLIGNLGADPEVIELEDGRKFARLQLATNEMYKDSRGELVEQTQWHKIVVWGKLVEVVEKYVAKGKQVLVSGKLSYRRYDDKEGISRGITEVICSDLMLLGGRQQ